MIHVSKSRISINQSIIIIIIIIVVVVIKIESHFNWISYTISQCLFNVWHGVYVVMVLPITFRLARTHRL
jgi:hypothetical protein